MSSQIRPIPEKDCFNETGFHYNDLVELTGVFGIYDALQKDFYNEISSGVTSSIVGYLENQKYDTGEELVTVEIKSPTIEILRIQLLTNDEIYIDYFILNNIGKGNNLGFYRLREQIEVARRMNFKRLSLWAYGDFSKYPKWDGYIIWGKYGFAMYLNNEKFRFAELMNNERLTHCTSLNVLVNSKEGTALWKYIGFDWKGVFSLELTSSNIKIFEKYKLDRNLL